MTMVFAITQTHNWSDGVHGHCVGTTQVCDFVDGTHFIIFSDHHAFHFVKSKHTHIITVDAVLGVGNKWM